MEREIGDSKGPANLVGREGGSIKWLLVAAKALAWLPVPQMGAHPPPSVSHSNLMRFVLDESH